MTLQLLRALWSNTVILVTVRLQFSRDNSELLHFGLIILKSVFLAIISPVVSTNSNFRLITERRSLATALYQGLQVQIPIKIRKTYGKVTPMLKYIIFEYFRIGPKKSYWAQESKTPLFR